MLSIFFLLAIFPAQSQQAMPNKEYTMLCLGDSYTIGEKADEADRFPNQAVMLLHSKGIFFEKPKIIAQTGWTTDELMAAIQDEQIKDDFDFVTLLIGVNNQYRKISIETYRKEFVELVDLAIKFSGGNKSHVIVLSIPDWGVTPFAAGRNRKKIAEEIDLFNAACKEESSNRKVHYIDVTTFTRQHPDWLVEDGLHPSGEMYALWAQELAKVIEQSLK